MGIRQLENGRWRLQIRRKKLSVDRVFDTEAEADAEQSRLLEKTSGPSTLQMLWERYEQSTDFADKAKYTRDTERSRIKPVLAALGHLSVQELQDDTSLIYDYMDRRAKVVSKRTGEKIGKATRRLEIAALSSVVAFAKKRKLVRENFVTGISRPATPKRRQRLAPVDQGKLSLNARNNQPQVAKASRFLLLVRHLGCRPGELRELRVKDVDLSRVEVLFRDTKNGTFRKAHLTKSSAELMHLQLETIDEASPYVFPSWSRRQRAWVPYNYASGVNLLRELGVIAPDYKAHAGRREFISRAIEENVPVTAIKKQSGHKSIQALELYDEATSTSKPIRAEFDRLDEAVRLEALKALVEASSLSSKEREQFLRVLGEKPIDPFEAKRLKLASKNGVELVR